MSRHTDFNLVFNASSQEELQEAISYLERKFARWICWTRRGKSEKELMRRVGAKNLGAVASWGFTFGEITVNDNGDASVKVTALDSNLSNVHIRGSKGELADLIEKFPDLEVSV